MALIASSSSIITVQKEVKVPHLRHHPTQSASHHQATPSAKFTKPNTQNTPRHPRRRPWFSLFILLACFLTFASAADIYITEELVQLIEIELPHDAAPGLAPLEPARSALARLAETGTILVDQQSRPDEFWRLATRNDVVVKEEEEDRATSAGVARSVMNLPVPLDSGYSSNVTATCAAFISDFLSNSTFQSCLPFSLLLQNSMSFFTAAKSLVLISETLDATCAADLAVCTPLMSSLASTLSSSAGCNTDLKSANPVIEQVRLGLHAYPTLYTASCLRNPTSGAYCFADAVTNSSSPTASYPYYLPLNVSLPGGSAPTCNTCLQETMAIFAAASSNRKSAISNTYSAAAQLVNMQCGPGFVNSTLAPAAATSAGASGLPMRGTPEILTLGMLALALLL